LISFPEAFCRYCQHFGITMRAFLCTWLFFCVLTLKAQVPSASYPHEALEDSIRKYEKAKNNDLALAFAKQWLEKSEQNPGKDSLNLAEALQAAGELRSKGKNQRQAESMLLKALELRTKAFGKDHLQVAETMRSLGFLYSNLNDYLKAEIQFLQALEIVKKVLNPGHPEIIRLLNDLGFLYDDIDDCAKSEFYYQQALELRRKTLGPEHPDVASTLNSIGLLHLFNFEARNKAEPYLLQALEIRKKKWGTDNTDVAKSLNNLGFLYTGLGQYAKARPYHLQALEIRRKILGPEHPEVARSLWHLGVLHHGLNELKQAESYYLQSLDIRRKTLDPNNEEINRSLNKLGELYFDSGLFFKAETCFLNSLEINKKNQSSSASLIMNLAKVYAGKGNYSGADSLYRIAKESLNSIPGTRYLNLHIQLNDQTGLLCRHQGKIREAAGFIKEAAALEMKFLRQYFPSLSEQEREAFFKLGSNNREKHKSFWAEEGLKIPELRGEFYNHQLFFKGLLLNTSARWKQRVKSSGDLKLIRRYDDWEVLQRKISKSLLGTEGQEHENIDTLMEKANKMEKELLKRSEHFARSEDRKQRTWQEVQQMLKPGEAAVEMVRFHKYGIARLITDTSDPKEPVYRVKGLSDTAQYAALILTKNSAQPELVILPNGDDLEEKCYNYYRNSIRQKQSDMESYRNFWQPIAGKLKGIKKVWFSADGVYHKLNPGTLKNPASGKFLMEEMEIAQLGSTKDLLKPAHQESENHFACLVGNPDFHPGQSSVPGKSRSGPELSYYFTPDPDLEISSLPGTQAEVDSIAILLQQKGWEVQEFTSNSADEGKIKDSYKPRLMLLSTHGFFRPDSSTDSNPLLRSGLLLTGSAITLREGHAGDGEDGILTAYEAMNLNLDNTELVVLSACETGLGQIRNGEGVYGLQRAFQVAGARNLIMSLWKVDDVVTRELMVAFFRHWLAEEKENNPDTDLLRKAFFKAQHEIRSRHPNPYYWGAFVLLGK